MQGWYTFDEVAIREHGGGGRDIAEAQPMQLAHQAAMLADKGVTVLAVHKKGVDAADLQAWANESGVTFPVGAITSDADIVKYTWAVRSLPWLILTDTKHVVVAEGFSANELDALVTETAER